MRRLLTARTRTPEPLAPPPSAAMLLHLLPLSCPAPPFHLRRTGGSSRTPRVRAGDRARTRGLRGTDVEPETAPRRRRGRDGDDPQAAGGGGDTGALLASVRRLLLSEAPAAAEGDSEEEHEQFPKRWAIVFLCFSAFLLCNMDRVRVTACVLRTTPRLHGSAQCPQGHNRSSQ